MRNLGITEEKRWLTWFYRGILIFSFLILFVRLVDLQVIKGKYYRDLSESNRIKRVNITAPRGRILARGGEELVGNVRGEGEFEWKRSYKLGAGFSHVSGYLGEVDSDHFGKVDPGCREKGVLGVDDLVGKSGLEKYYDCELRGVNGEELVEVDSRGKTLRVLGVREAVAGEDLKTTIDYGLQEEVSKVMSKESGLKGSIVVSDGKGEILAMYSSPSYDPLKVNDYLSDKNLPLFNRTISGAYPPGSVYKLVVAAAALEDEKINKDYRYTDTGSIKVGDFEYSNWYLTQYGRAEGEIDLVRAIARSTDTFFYKAGELVGIDELSRWSGVFGVGKTTGIDLPGEVSGLLPTPDWKKAVKGERWFLGNTYHMSIGQGDLLVTPLQVNMWTSVFANGGKLCKPHVAKLQSSNDKFQTECKDLGLKDETLKLVNEGMKAACSEGGTGYEFFDFDPEVACKTGTAETFENEETHAWFTVFAPAMLADRPLSNPQIVLTVLVEKGGEGSKVAAPLAHEILNYYFHKDEQKASPDPTTQTLP